MSNEQRSEHDELVQTDNAESERSLTNQQKALIERNRQRAILLRQKRQLELTTKQLTQQQRQVTRNNVDSGGGFLLDNDLNDKPTGGSASATTTPSTSNSSSSSFICDDCKQSFTTSPFQCSLQLNICRKCSQSEQYELITRTEAKAEYLLKDCDLDRREPKLLFILRANPNPQARHEMKLYLRSQVEQRALEVWGSEEKLEEQHEQRSAQREQRKQRTYQKKIKQLRMSVRSSLYSKVSDAHQHEFGDEIYDEENDLYQKTCSTCGHKVEFEKM